MAEQPQTPALTLGAIRWREVFPFTNLFRAFRIAIQPSKIVLGLVALLMLYFGGIVLDSLCRVRDRAVPDEVLAYEVFVQHARSGDRFSEQRDAIRRGVEASYAERLLQYGVVRTRDAADAAAHNGDDLPALQRAIERKRDADLQAAQGARDTLLLNARRQSGEGRRSTEVAARAQYGHAVRAIYDDAAQQYATAAAIRGQGLFFHFFNYELNQISNIVAGVAEGNFFGRSPPADLTMSLPAARSSDVPGDAAALPGGAGANEPATLLPTAAAESPARPGVIPALVRFFTVGPVWLLTQHPLYFLLLGMYFLALWAVFGGAISRIAAVHFARDEKLSMRSALRFSVEKFLSFFFAPIILLLLVLFLGLLVTLGSLLGNIEVVGPILIGATFFLALIAGFVMSAALLGLVGGFNLMYPTIAVEGSDSFDAISRSFSYLYAKPWRLAFYSAVAIIYGALTYQFVRLFIFLMLLLAHKFVGMGIYTQANNTAALWNTMWPNPGTAARLSYDVDYMALTWPQSIGAFLVGCWVYLTIALLGAFAISFYFSANTIIYYLMRREVDATEMDDVYLEPMEDEFADSDPDADAELPSVAEATATTAAATAPVADTAAAVPSGAPPAPEPDRIETAAPPTPTSPSA